MYRELPELRGIIIQSPIDLPATVYGPIERAKLEFLERISDKGADLNGRIEALRTCFADIYLAIARFYFSDISVPDRMEPYEHAQNGYLPLVFGHELVKLAGYEGAIWGQVPARALRSLLLEPEAREVLRESTDPIVDRYRADGTAVKIAEKTTSLKERFTVHADDTPAHDIRMAAIWELLSERRLVRRLEKTLRAEAAEAAAMLQGLATAEQSIRGREIEVEPTTERATGTGSRTTGRQLELKKKMGELYREGLRGIDISKALDDSDFKTADLPNRKWRLPKRSFAFIHNHPESRIHSPYRKFVSETSKDFAEMFAEEAAMA